MVRRLSAEMGTVRTPKPKQEQAVRKTLGAVLKTHMDDRILAGEFRDPVTRKFSTDLFEDEVRPIIDYMM